MSTILPNLDITGDAVGKELHRLVELLFPICRSITGDGVRQTLEILSNYIPLRKVEVPTGTQVFDWTVPKEWHIRDAYVMDSTGRRVVDFKRSNLHVLNYSMPIRQRMTLNELRPHLFTLPEHPDWIPYRTSYYKEAWGFCLSHNDFLAMGDPEYEVLIDSSLEQGHLTYGESFIAGATNDEVLICCHLCHPSLANDNLAAIAIATCLARIVSASRPRRYSYRFLFIPGTIGSITWLAMNEARIANIRHGLVLACAGDDGHPTYKKSKRGDSEIDRALIHILKESKTSYGVEEFSPYGYDERQFCSPGFNLPVGCFMRTPHGRYLEYHTSADNLELVTPRALYDSLTKVLSTFSVLECNGTYMNLNPKCEPQLGRRGLYGTFGGGVEGKDREMALLWVLNYSDGKHDLLDISEKSGFSFNAVVEAAEALRRHGLIEGVNR